VEYDLRIRVAVLQEHVNTYSTCRTALPAALRQEGGDGNASTGIFICNYKFI